MPVASPTRRNLLQLAGGSALASALFPVTARALTSPDASSEIVGRVLAVGDMHSAYERTPQLLAALAAEVRDNPAPHVIAINGDLFEHGNVVSVRSGGAVDWAFLEALPRIAPTVFNLGNHDNDLTVDLAEVVSRMKSLGLHVVSNIVDVRTERSYTEPSIEIPFGQRRLSVVGMATASLNTYPKASRETLSIPQASEWARSNLADRLAGSDLALIMSHAGVSEDRSVLPLVPDGSIMIGGHNHLLFQHQSGRTAYAHTGSWTNAYTVAEYLADGSSRAASKQISADAAADPALSQLTSATLEQHLTDEERQILGVSAQALSLGETGRQIALGMAQASGAHLGFMGHTTLGTGLPAGPVSQYVFDSIVRFDGRLKKATVTAVQAQTFATMANQDLPVPFDQRAGDFLYATGEYDPGANEVIIVTTDWCAMNQQEYFGTADLAFDDSRPSRDLLFSRPRDLIFKSAQPLEIGLKIEQGGLKPPICAFRIVNHHINQHARLNETCGPMVQQEGFRLDEQVK
ncbi:hypothetical protein LTR94_024888 [Friedmanniomyces endolithicus]|nr:hypothetical protein LTR94_024888 [Friedmanniomyces endolithicus]